MEMQTTSGKRSKALWLVLMTLFGLALVAQQRVRDFQSVEWITVDVPNPPAPLTYGDIEIVK